MIDTNKTDFSNDPLIKLLQKASGSGYDGRTATPFKRLHICQPALGLQEGADIIFFTTEADRLSENAWLVATDMRNKALLGVAAFFCSTKCVHRLRLDTKQDIQISQEGSVYWHSITRIN